MRGAVPGPGPCWRWRIHSKSACEFSPRKAVKLYSSGCFVARVLGSAMSTLPLSHERSLLQSGWDALRAEGVWFPRLVCVAVIIAAVFSGPLDIAEGAGGDLDARLAKGPSVLLKLATAAMAMLTGLLGITLMPKVRSILSTLPGLALVAVAFIFLATCLTSVTSASMPIAIVFTGYLLFIPTAIVLLELRGVMAATLIGSLLFTLAALFLYVFVPRYGVFPEDMGDGVLIERLGGMSQPNHTGRTAMLGLLIASYFLRQPRTSSWLCWIAICIFSIAGALAMSRTALLGAIICLCLLNLDLLLTRVGISGIIASAVMGVAALFALSAAGYEDWVAKKFLGAVTKTGDLEEVTQVTGRAEIWERALKLIKGRPLQGYGLGANKIMLKDHLQSTHNILLHPALAAGVIAGGLTFALLCWNLFNVFFCPHLLVRALSAYIIISGFTEDTIYETFPGACTLLWLFCCLWPAITDRGSLKSADVR